MSEKLPLHDAHAAAGASFEESDGRLLPARYSSLERECAAARDGGAVFDAGMLSLLVFSGPDRRDFLQGLLTNDAAALAPGGGQPQCLLTHKGKLIADFWLYDRGEDFASLQWPAAGESIRKGLAKYLPLSDTRAETTAGLGAFLLAGPAASSADAPFFSAPCGLAGAGGRIVIFPSGEGAGLWKRLLEKGFEPAGAEALETLRAENGRPRAGRDYAEDAFYPAELGLEEAVSYTKGCYLGQETVMRLKTQGAARHAFAGFKLSGPARPGDEVRSGGEPAGRVTSVCRSPRLGAPLALAAVLRAAAGPFEIAGAPAERAALPLP